MEPNVRRYFFRILLLHVAFLAAVAAVVAAAGIAVYATAQADTESDALERVSIPTNQTKLLLERHFQGIFETLMLADRELEPGASPPPSLLAAPLTGDELWFQLSGRLSALIELSGSNLDLVTFRANPEPNTAVGQSEGEGGRPAGRTDRVGREIPQALRSTLQTREQASRLTAEASDWLTRASRVGEPAVSGVFWVRGVSESGTLNNTPVVLAALPLPTRRPSTRNEGSTRATVSAAHTILVGIVPVGYLEENFLFPASLTERNGMLLFDSNAKLVAGGGESLAGRDVNELVPESLPPSLGRFIEGTVSGESSDVRRRFDGRVDLGTITFGSSLATARPVQATDRRDRGGDDTSAASPDADTAETGDDWGDLEDARPLVQARGSDTGGPAADAAESGQAPMWLIALVNRQAVVAPLEQTTRTAILWAIAMVVAVTAILVSSAVQLIRARTHLERLRTEMIDRELRDARHIQLMWLPDDEVRQTPTRQIEIAAHNLPASHISGDFYNYFDLADGRTAVVIGDVTGHGMTAAFLMATTQLLVRTTLQRLGDPGRTLEEVNDQLCMQAFHGQFVTIQLLVINTRTRELQAASAGHPPPLTRSADGKWHAMDIDPQLVLGVLEGSKYPTHTVPLEGRETLVMYTDGIIEVKNPAGVRFSLEQLLEQMTHRIGPHVASARELVEETMQVIRDFTDNEPQEDDLTLMAIHLSPHAAGSEPATEFSRTKEPGPAAGAKRS